MTSEQVLREAVERIRAMRPVTCDMTLAHEMADIADEALASHPAARDGEGGSVGYHPQLDYLKIARDNQESALKGWPGVQTPHYALSGAFKALGDEIQVLRDQITALTAKQSPTPLSEGAEEAIARIIDQGAFTGDAWTWPPIEPLRVSLVPASVRARTTR